MPIPLRVGLFLLIPHVWVGLFLMGSLCLSCAIAACGQEREAIVNSRQYVRAKRTTNCRITYSYDEAGRRHTDCESFTAAAYTSHPEGSRLPIRSFHVRGIGGSTVLTADSPAMSLAARVGLAVFWNGLIVAFFRLVCIAPLVERRLLRDGEAVTGQITSKTTRRGRSTSYVVRYAYFDRYGNRHAREMVVRKRDYDQARTGDAVTVFYDPMKPQASVLYSFGQYAVRDRTGMPHASLVF